MFSMKTYSCIWGLRLKRRKKQSPNENDMSSEAEIGPAYKTTRCSRLIIMPTIFLLRE